MQVQCSCGPLERTSTGCESLRPDPQCRFHFPQRSRHSKGAALTAEPLPSGCDGERIVIADEESARIYCWVGDCWEAIKQPRIDAGICDFRDAGEWGSRWAWVTRQPAGNSGELHDTALGGRADG